jgi:hypothetical protein
VFRLNGLFFVDAIPDGGYGEAAEPDRFALFLELLSLF